MIVSGKFPDLDRLTPQLDLEAEALDRKIDCLAQLARRGVRERLWLPVEEMRELVHRAGVLDGLDRAA